MSNNPSYFPFLSELGEETLKHSRLTEQDIIPLRHLKNVLVKSQLYEEAAYLRDLEKQVERILNAMASHGYIPEIKTDNKEEKVYSIADVNVMLSLATNPLKQTILHYEEVSRTAIVDHVARLIKENEELKIQIPKPEEKKEI